MTHHLGILGGGQLGRMLALSAQPLGVRVTVLEPNPEAPARFAATHIAAGYDDEIGLEQLSRCDTVTFEFENVPDTAAAHLAKKAAVFPNHESLSIAQDRWSEKTRFRELGIETAEFRPATTLDQARAAFDDLGPMVLKTRRFGYDGKGQAVVRTRDELERAHGSLNGAPAIAEELVPFKRELSIIACRSRHGQIVCYPLTENHHEGGILRTSIAPAAHVSERTRARAESMARDLLEHLDYVGVLALELFDVDGKLVANEFAPRVHNSGHWTIEGAVTSQFENHVRAVCGFPLGSTELRSPAVMTNLIGSIPDRCALLELSDSHLHDYDKAPRAGRKVGHVTTLGATPEAAMEKARRVQEVVSRG